MRWRLTDKSVKGVRYFRKWFDLEERMSGHSENKEVAFMWMELGHWNFLLIVCFDQLLS